MQPLVSIVIPYYNRPLKMERCLDAIANQTYTHYEIIIVDDCSEKPCPVKNEKITYIKNKTNLGPGLSRNAGMKKAKGRYIVFLDSDDYWHVDFLDKTVTALQNTPNTVMAYASGFNIDVKGDFVNKRRKKPSTPTTILPNILYRGRQWGTGGCLWNRKIVQDIRWASSRNWEDYVFDVSVATLNNQVVPVKENLVYYDISGTDKLSNQDKGKTLLEKNKSLSLISDVLIESKKFKTHAIKKQITVLTLINLAILIELGVCDGPSLKRSVKNVRSWRNPVFSNYVYLVGQMPQKIAVKLIVRLKRSVNRERFTFIG
ncbi:glycosyltransferase family 2 protein [Marixanthomonas ophiurae]|uniref:Glycosyltransferase family 2 protein n=1 Tax=Marixanthomonas ophiurae TaxID=387659 RepID=A0A3E1QDB0_9FLAO|nr:glycosyltransferase family 2 protein [Marixanthomonas ophiurae]RFN60046.1 glycosyltransferase family 2 protein [Marixanthomonas ophiurae]